MGNINIVRIAYLVPAVLCDAVFIYFALNPGTTKEEWFGSFLMTSWMLIGSIILSAPVFPYVVWRLVKRERPLFWSIALFVAAVPLLWVLFGAIFG